MTWCEVRVAVHTHIKPRALNITQQAQRLQRDMVRHAAIAANDLKGLAAMEATLPADDRATRARVRTEGTATAQALVLFEQLQQDLAAGALPGAWLVGGSCVGSLGGHGEATRQLCRMLG